MLRQGGPYLLAVDDEFVAVTYRAGGQRRQVRTGIGFGISLAPDMLAAERARQIIALLFG